MAGEKVTMQTNSEQHEDFQPGLKEYKDFVESCLAGRKQYDGKKFQRILDGFASTLWQHLSDEMPSFDDLWRYGDKLKGFHATLAAEAKETVTELGILAGAVFVIANHDVNYESGSC